MALTTTRSCQPVTRRGIQVCPAPSRRRTTAVRALGIPIPDAPLFAPEDVERATYAVLGLTATSFLGTFLIIPRFKDQFKEDVDWRTIYADLVASGGVREITAEEAYRKKSLLLDVRVSSKYSAGHASGALSAPLYLPIQKWDVPSVLRRAAFAFFGIAGTELNPEFVADVGDLAPKGKEVVLICEMGGSLENKPGTQFGFQSRALKAAYYLKKAGYNKVAYVKGGMALWSSAGLPIEGGDGAEAEFAVRSAAVSQKTGTRSLRQAGTGGNKRFGLFGRRE